jgi:hypothetical protein
MGLGLILLSSLLLNACGDSKGSGRMGAKNITLSGFKSLSVCNNAIVNITRTGKEAVKITADDNLLSKIGAEVVSGELVLNCTKAAANNTLGLTQIPVFVVEFAQLNNMTIDGSVELKSTHDKKGIKSDDFSLTANGNSKINLSLISKNVQLQLNGQGVLVLRGESENVQGMFLGDMNLHAERFNTQNATLILNGNAKTFIRTEKNLEVTINGAGSVYYDGGPLITQNITGTGTVSKIQASMLEENLNQPKAEEQAQPLTGAPETQTPSANDASSDQGQSAQ